LTDQSFLYSQLLQLFHLSFLYFSRSTFFLNLSDYLVSFLISPCHHFSTMAALFKAHSSLESVSCCFPPIFQRILPLSQAMTLPQPRHTQSEGVYAAISVRDIVNIPSSIKKTLIHRRISLNSLPLVSFLKIASAHKKYRSFLAANSIIYPSNVVLTQKSIARMTGQSNL
jgi:hypothetical protein